MTDQNVPRSIDMKPIPQIPAALVWPLRWAPLMPLRLAARRMTADLTRRRPKLFTRLGAQAGKSVTIDPTDLPFVFSLATNPQTPRLDVFSRGAHPQTDARIAGPLAALIGLVHGAYDGDALFFSRDLTVEGDTELIVALRNAIDNEEMDLAHEAAALFGPFARAFRGPFARASRWAGRLSGIPLTRRESW